MTYIHNIDPFAIQLNWNILGFHLDGIRWYGLAYLSAFFSGYWMIIYLAKKKRIALPIEKAGDFTTYAALGALIGGRLGYSLFYSPEVLTDFHSQFPFWGVLEVHKGGMASHGGVLGIMVAAWLFTRKNKISVLELLDFTVIGGSIGFFFGRIANFINGELYGRECPPGLSWAVKFPQEVYRWLRDVNVGTLEEKSIAIKRLKAFGPAVEQLSPIQISAEQTLKTTSAEWSSWIDGLMQPGFARNDGTIYQFFDWMIDRIQAGNSQLEGLVGPFLVARYPSQLIQSLMEGLLVFIVLVLIWLKPRKPGVVASWFGILYAFMRILGEQFRMPDAQIGFDALGLTRGQWLSAGMVLAAVVMLIYSMKRQVPKHGGFFIR